MRKWSIIKLITAGSLGILWTLLSLIGLPITYFTNIPGVQGALSFIFAGVFWVLACLIIKKFGAATLMAFIRGILSLPLNYFGPPGFFQKY